MIDPKTMKSNTAVGLLTGALLIGAACALWLGAPLLSATVNGVFASDIPVVRLSHPQIATHGARLNYFAVVATSRKLAVAPKLVLASRSAQPVVYLSRARAVLPVAKARVATQQRTATAAATRQVSIVPVTAVATRQVSAVTVTAVATRQVSAVPAAVTAAKVDGATSYRSGTHRHSSSTLTTTTDRHRGKATLGHRGTPRRKRH